MELPLNRKRTLFIQKIEGKIFYKSRWSDIEDENKVRAGVSGVIK